ncbi:MAG: DcaP family trimeric outer membrane transporter, partial [Bythopirellula sp.]
MTLVLSAGNAASPASRAELCPLPPVYVEDDINRPPTESAYPGLARESAVSLTSDSHVELARFEPQNGIPIGPIQNTKAHIGGYVKLDAIHDFDAIGKTDQFDVGSIPTDGRPGENSRLHARQTRLNLDTRFLGGTRDLRVFVEGDFFNQDDTSFRLRHAFAEVGGFTVGQTWTTFMDEGPGPRIVDFENPSGYIIDRRALLRYEYQFRDTWILSLGIEESGITISEPAGTTGTTNSLWPDSIARIRWEHSHFHLQTAAVIREFQFQADLTNETQDVTGWGFNFSGRAEVTGRDTSYFEITFGEGIGGFRGVPDAGPDALGVLEA